MKSYALKVFAALLTILLFCFPSRSQQTVGGITGTVSDPTGAAVPDATVKAVNTGTNLTVTVKSGATGTYSITDLPVGVYKVTFSKDRSEEHTSELRHP
jgi:2-methylcitrate dehydratase PrpD